MQKELLAFIGENGLSPFNQYKTAIKDVDESIYQTKDAKAVHTHTLTTLGARFAFADTASLFHYFTFARDFETIRKRQEFFRQAIPAKAAEYLAKIKRPRPFWKPSYGVLVVTEDEKTFTRLQQLGCPIKFIITQYDLEMLDNYDIVQVVECEQFSGVLENLPQTVFLDSADEAYLERYVELLSGWKDTLTVLKDADEPEIAALVSELYPLLELLEKKDASAVSREDLEIELGRVNEQISTEIKKLTISGDILFSMLSKNQMPPELAAIAKKAVSGSTLDPQLVNVKIPVELDELAVQAFLKKQAAELHTSVAEKIKKRALELRAVPGKLKRLADQLLVVDFLSGIGQYALTTESFPQTANELKLVNSKNLFLDSPQPISFVLTENERCSILTGANSGGKTTLLEHVIQLITLFQLGLPVSGKLTMPIFSEVYYFAKTKGSANKGAFETLLGQMSHITPGRQTLILADEIEAVTEPGVAGSIVAASAEYFLKRGCFLIVATHLGKEIQHILPQNARIDGIEAKGLDEQFELIVDHNPVLGRLAHSTPELIVEKLAIQKKGEYFTYLHDYLKKSK